MSNRAAVERALARFADPGRREEHFQLYSHDIVLHGYQGIEPGIDNVKRFYLISGRHFPTHLLCRKNSSNKLTLSSYATLLAELTKVSSWEWPQRASPSAYRVLASCASETVNALKDGRPQIRFDIGSDRRLSGEKRLTPDVGQTPAHAAGWKTRSPPIMAGSRAVCGIADGLLFDRFRSPHDLQ